MKKVIVDEHIFKSIKEASEFYKISYRKVINKIVREKISAEDAIKEILNETDISKKEEIYEEKKDDNFNINEEDNEPESNIEGLIELLSSLSYNDINNINLIDFENINENKYLDKYIKNKDSVNIFFFNACYQSNKYYRIIRSSKSINIPVMIFESQDQLIDKLILLVLGSLIIKMPKKQYTIISKDKGYDEIINTLSYSYNINKYSNEDDKNPKEKFIYYIY